MCGALMFLMKSTELHWSTGNDSELSKAIRQVKTHFLPRAARVSVILHGLKKELLHLLRQNCGGDTHVQLCYWCHRGVNKDKNNRCQGLQKYFLVIYVGLVGVWNVDQGCQQFLSSLFSSPSPLPLPISPSISTHVSLVFWLKGFFMLLSCMLPSIEHLQTI